MDTIKIGEFLTVLRKEKGLTQAQLGGKIGVTNKTISRWENGNYLPSVDMLKLLSEEFNVTINEIINGERISNGDYKKVVDENLSELLTEGSFTTKSVFTVNEKIKFWRNRWLRQNRVKNCIIFVLFMLALFYGFIIDDICLISVVSIVCFILRTIEYNRMMSYIERNAF